MFCSGYSAQSAKALVDWCAIALCPTLLWSLCGLFCGHRHTNYAFGKQQDTILVHARKRNRWIRIGNQDSILGNRCGMTSSQVLLASCVRKERSPRALSRAVSIRRGIGLE